MAESVRLNEKILSSPVDEMGSKQQRSVNLEPKTQEQYGPIYNTTTTIQTSKGKCLQNIRYLKKCEVTYMGYRNRD